jgi:predicted dehydrogenase
MQPTVTQEARDFGWAVIGPGRIAQQFAQAVHALSGTRLQGVLGRNPERAAAFSQRWSMPDRPVLRNYRDLDALLADPEVDAVYVATTHDSHADFVRACLSGGKPVLCEKPLVPTLAQAQEIVALARQRQVFLMEALWTRLLPIYRQVRRWLDADAIGAVQGVQSSFCFNVPYAPQDRLFNPHLAGGTLLDIGIYNLALTRWVLEPAPGRCPEPIEMAVSGLLAPSGVDQRVAATLTFAGGVHAQFVCAFDMHADNALRILGRKGTITVKGGFWAATEAVLSVPGTPDEVVHAPLRINGFEEQIEDAMRCVRAGRTESDAVPLAETLGLIGWIESLRRRVGVSYPFD